MKEPNIFLQDTSLRTRVIITVGIFIVLVIGIGLYSFIAIVETNKRLNNSVLEGEVMARTIETARLAQVHFKKQVQAWKNILLRGNDEDSFKRHLRIFNEEDRLVTEYLQMLSQAAAKAGLSVPEIGEAIKVHEELGRRYREALKGYKASDLKSAVMVDKKVRGIDRKPTEQIDAIVDLIKVQTEQRLKATTTMAKIKLKAYKVYAYFLLFLVVLSVGFGIYNARSIIKDLPPEGNENSRESEEL